MAKSIKPADLEKALEQELTMYHEDITERVNEAGVSAITKLVQKTKATAPVLTGDFKKSISSKVIDAGHGMKKFVWFVKAPNYRLTHLLVHGHATKNGGRTKADPFLQNALDTVLPEYEEAVKEAVKK